ncbi:hypothetical protein M422DRAFT_269628 [Sphaerobolus stellatus SS14]|uniref:Uncharacterized protein n=1 Tax=Sphaerobolus stellatus (strain SS14) TaxID=990650 RepID=A0A0C9UJE3_SPHS4|nr:hypothetical protein M422DRAFT_269628 [Sphaerobolus stellatus SS14]
MALRRHSGCGWRIVKGLKSSNRPTSAETNSTGLDVEFIIGIRGSQPPPSVTIRYIADRWMGAEAEIIDVFDDELTMRSLPNTHTPLLDLAFLPVADSLSSNINR